MYQTCIIKLIVINSTCLFPARESGVYWGLLTLPNVFINETHNAQAETILFDCINKKWKRYSEHSEHFEGF